MAAEVKVPGIGEVPRTYVYLGGAVVAGAVGFAYLRRAADPGAEVGAEDPTGEAGDYAAGDYAPGADSYSNPAPATITTPAEVDPDTLPPTTNSAWTSRSVDRLGDVGYDPRAVAAALGRYLGRQPLASQLEVEIVRTALAMVGPPPTGEYSIQMPTPGPSTPPPPAGAPTAPKPAALAAPAGLRVKSVAPQNVQLDWTKVPGAVTYQITATGAGATTTRTVTASAGYITKLRPQTRYTFTVRAINAKGTKGPSSAPVSATTKRK